MSSTLLSASQGERRREAQSGHPAHPEERRSGRAGVEQPPDQHRSGQHSGVVCGEEETVCGTHPSFVTVSAGIVRAAGKNMAQPIPIHAITSTRGATAWVLATQGTRSEPIRYTVKAAITNGRRPIRSES